MRQRGEPPAAMAAEVDRGGLRDARASVAELPERWFDVAANGPHFTIVLPDAQDATLDRLDGCFGGAVPNPGR